MFASYPYRNISSNMYLNNIVMTLQLKNAEINCNLSITNMTLHNYVLARFIQ